MVIRETYVYLLAGTAQTNSFLVEIIFGVIVPWIMLLSPGCAVRAARLFTACTLIVGGVLLNRINVFVVGYRPPVSENNYFPSITEMLITVGFIAGLMFLYRFFVTYDRLEDTRAGGVRMTKRLSGVIALLTALTAIGGLIGFLAGGPSPPEAIAVARSCAGPWLRPNQRGVDRPGPGGRQEAGAGARPVRRGRHGRVPVGAGCGGRKRG